LVILLLTNMNICSELNQNSRPRADAFLNKLEIAMAARSALSRNAARGAAFPAYK
jgi:hypothetical protein